MTSEYKYYKRNGKLMRLHIEQEEEPLNPRYDWDGNIGKMMCWHRNYKLGDYKENKFVDNEDFLNDLVRENIKDTTLINYVKNKKTSNGLELRYDRHEKMWQLWGTYYWFPIGSSKDAKFGIIEEHEDVTWLIDEIIEALPQIDKWKLLERHANIVFLPLYLYDHIIANLPRERSLRVGYITNQYLKSLCKKKGSYEKMKEDMKLKMLKGKEYIHSIGKWDEYIKYIKTELEKEN